MFVAELCSRNERRIGPKGRPSNVRECGVCRDIWQGKGEIGGEKGEEVDCVREGGIESGG